MEEAQDHMRTEMLDDSLEFGVRSGRDTAKQEDTETQLILVRMSHDSRPKHNASW